MPAKRLSPDDSNKNHEIVKEKTATTSENKKPNPESEENPPKRRSTRVTRSQRCLADGTPSPEKPEKKLSFIKYKGAIKYYTDKIDIAATSDELMTWVAKQDTDIVPIAFDLEWPFSFQTGPGKVALMQLCLDEKECYLFHVCTLSKIPASLMALLAHPKVRLHGVNIKNDIRKLKRDFPEVTVDTLIENCIDLGPWCNEVCNTGGRWSLDRLSAYICDKAIDKNKKVRMSKWHVVPLDDNQKMYAAIDVYIGQLIYRELERREILKKKNQEEFLEKNGEAALKAVKALGENFL